MTYEQQREQGRGSIIQRLISSPWLI